MLKLVQFPWVTIVSGCNDIVTGENNCCHRRSFTAKFISLCAVPEGVNRSLLCDSLVATWCQFSDDSIHDYFCSQLFNLTPLDIAENNGKLAQWFRLQKMNWVWLVKPYTMFLFAESNPLEKYMSTEGNCAGHNSDYSTVGSHRFTIFPQFSNRSSGSRIRWERTTNHEHLWLFLFVIFLIRFTKKHANWLIMGLFSKIHKSVHHKVTIWKWWLIIIQVDLDPHMGIANQTLSQHMPYAKTKHSFV